MGFDQANYPHSELTHQIIGAAFEVHSCLRPGLDEKVYETALTVELGLRGLDYQQQRRFPVTYKDKVVGTLVPDLIVEGKVVIETKVTESFSRQHEAQLLGYLAITGLEIGLLLNLKHQKVHSKRIASLANHPKKHQ